MTEVPRRQARGTARRDAIVRGAADLILSEGPAAVTHRAVAARAGVPLAATTYYFTGLDELLAAAGQVIVAGWAEHARAAGRGSTADRDRPDAADLVVGAVLPPGGADDVRGFYEHLVSAGRHPALARAYADGRDLIDEAVTELLRELGHPDVTASLVVAVVDGAAVSALSEGRDVRAHAVRLTDELFSATQ
ncbi:TetR family transcriptional regulator [Cellulosimicrobium terreum]|nr:TetR family transcriptional regulator [Cellulosimicrobium terreum]